jgi:hypothetical protein
MRYLPYFTYLIFLLALSSNVSAGEVADASTSSQLAFEECKAKIMTLNGQDIERINPNEVISACQKFPLSDDVFVQVLGAIVGPDLVVLLDMYTALTGKAHGFVENSSLFTVATPLHATFKALNYLFFGVLIILISFSVAAQSLRWQGGNFKIKLSDWTASRAVDYATSIFLSLPMFGWMTPLQGLGILIIILLGYVAKMAVAYVFLAAFFGNVTTEIKAETENAFKYSFGKAIVLYECDMRRREGLIAEIQNQLGSRKKSVLETNSLYTCLTSTGAGTETYRRLESVSPSIATYEYMPAALNQTQKCVVDNRESLLSKWGVDDPDKCGAITLTVPINENHPGSKDTAKSLYASPAVNTAQREIAMQYHQYKCRVGEREEQKDSAVTSCMKPIINGDRYTYAFIANEITGDDELTYYREPLTALSKETFVEDIKKKLAVLQSLISNNTSLLLQHLKDLMASGLDASASRGTEAETQRARDRLLNELNGESTLGVSESDAEYLVNNIKRGVWTSSSLFFDGLADGLNEEVLVDRIKDVYNVEFGPAIDQTLEYWDIFKTYMSLTDLEFESGALRGQDSSLISGTILPRVNLYTENASCWFKQSACETQPLNPFTYLAKQGVDLVDEALYKIFAIRVIEFSGKLIMGFGNNPKKNRLMLFQTVEELVWVYFILGAALCVLIPGIPFLKLMAMMINWAYDVARELISLQIKIAFSPLSEHGDGVLAADIKEAFNRLIGLGLYFLFILVGVAITFLMFSFLYSINVFLVGVLSNIVNWGGELTVLDGMILNVVFDIIIVFLLVYEIKKCTPFMEKIPKELAEHFGIKVSNSDGVVDQAINFIKREFPGGAESMLKKLSHK